MLRLLMEDTPFIITPQISALVVIWTIIQPLILECS